MNQDPNTAASRTAPPTQRTRSAKSVARSRDAAALSAFTEGRTLLLNPTPGDITRALAAVQRRARQHLLTDADALEVHRRVVQENQPHAHDGVRPCPASYSYGVTSTVIQVARLHDGLIGCSVGRQEVLPGAAAQPPIVCDPYEHPRRWLAQVTKTFWTCLDDEQLAAIEQWAVGAAMAYAAGQQPAARGRRGKPAPQSAGRRALVRRRLQLAALFRAARPVYVPELAGALQCIADELRDAGQSTVGWREFQQRWPSLASRHKRDLIDLFRHGPAATDALLMRPRDSAKYRLRFTTWSGAQTVFTGTQLVFQVCSSLLGSSDRGDRDADAALMARALREVTARSAHPVTPQTVGWLRVHVDDLHRLVFVDEVQSDVLEMLRLLERDGDATARALAARLADWQVDGFSSVRRWAATIGYRIGLHSPASAQAIPGKTSSARKWNTYYGVLVKRFGLTLQTVPGYAAPVYVDH